MWLNGSAQYSDHLIGKTHTKNTRRQRRCIAMMTRQLLLWTIMRACGASELAGLRSALHRRGRVLPDPAWQSIRLFLETPREFLTTYLGERNP